MKRKKPSAFWSELLGLLFRLQWLTVCLPELFLGVIAGFWFMSDLPKPDAADLRAVKALVFAGYLLLCVLVKYPFYFRLFRGRGRGMLSWSFFTFFLSMIELGFFFDLYIIGWSAERSFQDIAEYILYWVVPLVGILAIGGGAALVQHVRNHPGTGNSKFSRRLHHAAERKRRRNARAKQEKPESRAEGRSAADFFLSGPGLVLLTLLVTGLSVLIFFRFRNVLSTDTASLNLRSRFVEASKILLFGLLILYHAAMKRQDRPGISRGFAGFMTMAACACIAGSYLIGREAGSLIVIAIFAVLVCVHFYSRKAGLFCAGLAAAGYGIGMALERYFRTAGYPAWVTETITTERWDRLFNMAEFPQVREMRTVLMQSAWLRGLTPYNVTMSGRIYTRVEDFSYLNLCSVFGKLAAVAVMAAYIILLLQVFYRLDDALRRDAAGKTPHPLTFRQRELFVLAQFMSISIAVHAAVHVVSNLSFLFFTGVPLPFISKGLSNLAVMLICSAVIVYCLRLEEQYARGK